MSSGFKDTEDYILRGGLWRLMVDLAWPAIVGMSFYALNTFVDVIFIGQLVGEQAVAGVSLAFPLASIPMGVAAMLGSGGGSLLSIAIGAGDSGLHKRLSGLTGSLAIIATLPMAAVGAVFPELFFQWMGGSGEPLRLGAQYFSVLSLFFPVTVYAISANMLVRAEGRMRTAMKILAVSTVVNVALNPLFIRTFGLGIRGSALATNVAMVALAAAGAVYFRSGKSSAREPVPLFAYDPKVLKRIISIGLSSFILQGMGVLQQIFVFRLIAAHGTEKDVALMGTGLRILFLCVYPVMGIVRALQPVIGINFGARQYARVIEALRVFSIGGTAFMTLIWLPLTIFSRTVLGWMLPDTAITDTDVLNFRILIVTLPLMAGVFNGLTFFQAIGHGKTATILAVSRQILVFVPVVLILPVYFGVSGIYYSLTGVDVTLIAVLAMLVLREFKLLSAKPDGAER